MHKWEWHQKCPVLASATLKDATQIEPIPSITFQFHFASKEGKILFNIKKKRFWTNRSHCGFVEEFEIKKYGA
jgi:hypothetical protein